MLQGWKVAGCRRLQLWSLRAVCTLPTGGAARRAGAAHCKVAPPRQLSRRPEHLCARAQISTPCEPPSPSLGADDCGSARRSYRRTALGRRLLFVIFYSWQRATLLLNWQPLFAFALFAAGAWPWAFYRDAWWAFVATRSYWFTALAVNLLLMHGDGGRAAWNSQAQTLIGRHQPWALPSAGSSHQPCPLIMVLGR